jgi:hypothetical protein
MKMPFRRPQIDTGLARRAGGSGSAMQRGEENRPWLYSGTEFWSLYLCWERLTTECLCFLPCFCEWKATLRKKRLCLYCGGFLVFWVVALGNPRYRKFMPNNLLWCFIGAWHRIVSVGFQGVLAQSNNWFILFGDSEISLFWFCAVVIRSLKLHVQFQVNNWQVLMLSGRAIDIANYL